MTISGKRSRPRSASKRSTRSARITRNGEESPKGDFEELFACFGARRVKYLIVGGYAVAFHAKPRFTKDIDLWIERSRTNARRVLAALRDFGAPTGSLREGDFTESDRILVIGVAPNRVDILSSIPGVEFEDAWPERVAARYGRVRVHYISREDLLRNKEAVGRPIDRLDAAWLRRVSPPRSSPR